MLVNVLVLIERVVPSVHPEGEHKYSLSIQIRNACAFPLKGVFITVSSTVWAIDRWHPRIRRTLLVPSLLKKRSRYCHCCFWQLDPLSFNPVHSIWMGMAPTQCKPKSHSILPCSLHTAVIPSVTWMSASHSPLLAPGRRSPWFIITRSSPVNAFRYGFSYCTASFVETDRQHNGTNQLLF